ncbi:MAG: AAA family ATPase [Thermoleophilia bacterium]|nr:AAA family ATPase [Thermoleophilia bacterium]
MDGVVIGRERELELADGFLAEAADRSGALAFVGDAGIGKTTLWSAVVEDAIGRGYVVLTARPSQAEAGLPFAVLTDLFASMAEHVLTGLPEAQQAALGRALRRRTSPRRVDPTAVALATLGTLRLLSEARPVVVAVDDLQWVDAPSMRALAFALRRLDRAAVGYVATVRSDHERALETLTGGAPALVGRIELAGLGAQHLAEVVFERTGRTLTPPQLGRLAKLSSGNPFYALELAATGDPGLAVPDTLAGALRTRLSALTRAGRGAGLTAATMGRVDEALIRRLHGRGIDELLRAGVVEDRHGTSRFAHPLLASTLLEMHTEEERRAAHLALATALEDPDERALHLGQGTDVASEAVAAELEQVARRFDARGAPEAAARLVERAAALTPEGDGEATTRRLLAASDLYQAAGEGARVLPLLRELVETLPAGPSRARVLLRLGWLGAQMDTMPGSEAVSYQRQALAEADGAPDVVGAANAALARLLGNGGDYREAHRHAELAVAEGAVTESTLMFPSSLGELAIARFMVGEGFDESLFGRGVELESAQGVGEPYQTSKLQLALALLYTGRLARARAVLYELLERSRELGRVRSTAGCVLHLIEVEVRAGRLAEAEAHAAEFVHLDRQLRGDLSCEWYPSARVAVSLGREEDARRILGGGIEYSRSIESTIWLAHELWALGHLELSLGNLAAAADALVPLVPMLRATGLGEWSVHPVHPDAIEALVGLGEIDQAAELTAELEEYGRRLDRPWGKATAARSRALLDSARGASGEALAAAEQALEEHERLDWPFERARTLLVAGMILRRHGRRREAAGRIDEARAAFASLRSPLWLAKAEAEARRLGGRRKAGGALTPAEQRVAELAVAGLRNAEIAARLYVTPKTVEATLSRVYRKLGVRSRTELARLPAPSPASPASPAHGATPLAPSPAEQA